MPIDTRRGHLRGIDLRYLLTAYLHELGPLSVAQLVSELTDQGFELTGRPSKTISDALRWERRRGRVIRVGRGRYAAGHMPRQTASRITARVRLLQEERAAATWAD